MNDWQPIEAAPNGEWVLCARAGASSRWSRWVGILGAQSKLWTDANGDYREPTHWMPLLDAPT